MHSHARSPTKGVRVECRVVDPASKPRGARRKPGAEDDGPVGDPIESVVTMMRGARTGGSRSRSRRRRVAVALSVLLTMGVGVVVTQQALAVTPHPDRPLDLANLQDLAVRGVTITD